jgi:hypothetical protein
MSQNPTCLSYWYPRIRYAGLPVPRTLIIHAPLLLTYEDVPTAGLDDLLWQIDAACGRVGYPAFLRTGLTSAKHDWKESCFIAAHSNIASHVNQILEYSEMVDFLGLDCSVWAVREMLPTKPMFHAFNGMPIVREFRFFVEDGKVTHVQPYWPADSIQRPDVPDWEARLAHASEITQEERGVLSDMARTANAYVPGDWSVDFLETENGWYLTDMAVAAESFRYGATL